MKMKFLVSVLALFCFSNGVLAQRELDENPCLALPAPGNGFVNDPSSCPSYFSCIAFLPFRMKCDPPFYFDPINLICNFPQFVKCSFCRASGVHGVRDPNSCTRWTLCVNGIMLPQECPPGTEFDEAAERCNLAEIVNCGPDRDTCGSLDGGIGLAPSPESCDAYNYCYNGEKLMRGQCLRGLAFDTKTNRCVRSSEATCFPGTSF